MSIIFGQEHKSGKSFPANWGDPACRSETHDLVDMSDWIGVEVSIDGLGDLLQITAWIRERLGDYSENRWTMKVEPEIIRVFLSCKRTAMLFKLTWA